MFINVHSVSSSTPTSLVPNARLLSAIHSTGIKWKLKKLLTLLHLAILSFCNIHDILQDAEDDHTLQTVNTDFGEKTTSMFS